MDFEIFFQTRRLPCSLILKYHTYYSCSLFIEYEGARGSYFHPGTLFCSKSFANITGLVIIFVFLEPTAFSSTAGRSLEIPKDIRLFFVEKRSLESGASLQ